MRGYIETLRAARQAPDTLGSAIIATGQAAGGLAKLKDDNDERQATIAARLRELARGKVKDLQAGTQMMLDNGQNEGAARLSGQIPGAFKEATGIDVPARKIVGGVRERYIETPGPMPGRTVRESDFSGADTTAAIRGQAMLPKPKAVAPEIKGFDPEDDIVAIAPDGTVKTVRSGKPKAFTPRDPRLVQNPDTGEWFTPQAGLVSPVPPKMMAVTAADGSVSMVPVTPQTNNQPRLVKPPPKPQPLGEADLDRDAKAAVPSPYGDKYVPKPVENKRLSWKKEQRDKRAAEIKAWTETYGGNPSTPGGRTAAPAGNRRGPLPVSRSKIPPPVKYEDTALLPEWEAHAREAVTMAPGSNISSRARSVERNRLAKPGGGAPDSWHLHRQAFDLEKYRATDIPKLRAWANSKGLYMIDEGNHLHFQPLQGVSTGGGDQLAAFYERHGIQKGGTNA